VIRFSNLIEQIFYIDYKNNSGKASRRFIKLKKIIPVTKEKEKTSSKQNKNNKSFILKAYCYYKEEIRHFNTDHINLIYTINADIEKILKAIPEINLEA